MYGVNLEKRPQNWQIIQQEDGFGIVELAGNVVLKDTEWECCSDQRVFIRVLDEDTETRILPPVMIPVTKENNAFSTTLKIPAGGLYRIESYVRLNGSWEKRGDRILHLGVGDVYVITGQSNAVGIGRDSISDPVSNDVHVFRANGKWDVASHPLHDFTDSIFPDGFDEGITGHSPWINFGKILAKALGYPIGLIPAAKGGVSIDLWDRGQNGILFNNMVKMVEASGTSVKGVIWYQGCNEVFSPQKQAIYAERFAALYKDFESVFYKGVPVFTLQLNKDTCSKDRDLVQVGEAFSSFREIQRQIANTMENVYIAPTLDLPVCDGIHNSGMSTLVIGQRVADMALNYLYGMPRVCDAPQIDKITREDEQTLMLHFNNVHEMLFSDLNSTDTLMFTVTDEQGKSLPIDYECMFDNRVKVKFDRKIGKNATVSCDRYNGSELIIYDMYSYLPILTFHNVVVED